MKRPEQILYKLKTEVETEYFKASPLKVFPDDFLSVRVKKGLAAHLTVSLPEVKLCKRITGVSHRDRRKKVDIDGVMKDYYRIMAIEKNSADSYFVIGLPIGKLKLNAHRKFEICNEKGDVLLEFDSLEQAKYLLYARKDGQFVYKLPKSKVTVKHTVEKYEKYLDEVHKGLMQTYMKRGFEREVAKELAKLWKVRRR